MRRWNIVHAQVEYCSCAGRAERFSLPDQVDCGIPYRILPPPTKGEHHIRTRCEEPGMSGPSALHVDCPQCI